MARSARPFWRCTRLRPRPALSARAPGTGPRPGRTTLRPGPAVHTRRYRPPHSVEDRRLSAWGGASGEAGVQTKKRTPSRSGPFRAKGLAFTHGLIGISHIGARPGSPHSEPVLPHKGATRSEDDAGTHIPLPSTDPAAPPRCTPSGAPAWTYPQKGRQGARGICLGCTGPHPRTVTTECTSVITTSLTEGGHHVGKAAKAPVHCAFSGCLSRLSLPHQCTGASAAWDPR